MYDDSKLMQKRIDAYFAHCDARIINIGGDAKGKAKTRPNPEPYTVEGLCDWLGFESRNALQQYVKKAEFSCTIKRARLKIVADNVRRLLEGKNQTGAIFWLKNNANYRDRTESEHSDMDGTHPKPERIMVIPKELVKALC